MKNLSFQNLLALSLVSHFILFFLVLDFDWNAFSRKPIVTGAIRVDIVSLPDTVSSKKKSAKKPKTSLAIKSKSSSLNKKQIKKPDASKVKKPEFKGNQISKGTEVDGEAKVQTNIYITEIAGIIKSHWNIPSYIKDQNLQAEIEVKIDNNGNIILKKIIKSSNNSIFDLKVLDAIKNAEPFPKPPTSTQRLLKEGIVFVLNSQDN